MLIFQYEINPCLHQNESAILFLTAQPVTEFLFIMLRFLSNSQIFFFLPHIQIYVRPMCVADTQKEAQTASTGSMFKSWKKGFI